MFFINNNLISGQYPEADRPYKCDVCGKAYLHIRNLHRHVKLECGKAPGFNCSVCSYKAYQKVHVQKHVRRKHPDVYMMMHPSNILHSYMNL